MASPTRTIKDYFQGKQITQAVNDQASSEDTAKPDDAGQIFNHDVGQNGRDIAQAYCKEIQSKLALRTLLLQGDPWVRPSLPLCRMQYGPASPSARHGHFQHWIFAWSPEHLFPGFKMTCPSCKCAVGSSEWVRPRILHGLTQISYYLTCRYYCVDCGASNSKASASKKKPRKVFMADAQDVLAQLPMGLAAVHNLIDSGKIICEVSVLDFVRSMATRTSWRGIAEALNELKARSLQKCLLAPNKDDDFSCLSDEWDDFAMPREYLLHDQWVRNMYVKDGHSRKAHRAEELELEKGDDILMLDWTKDAAARSGGTWLFNAMDSGRRILAFKLTNTCKPKEVEDILHALAKRGVRPEVVYVDDECCGSWADIVGRIWPQCSVRLDPFHAMRRLTTTVSSTQHPWHGEFCYKLSSAIHTFDLEVVDKLEAARMRQTLSSRIPRPEMLKHVPRSIENPQKIMAAISKLLADFKSRCHHLAGPLLTTETENAWSCLQQHISHGCLCDPKGVNLYQTTGKQAMIGGEVFPVLRSRRGSSALEGFHTHQKQWLGMLASHGQEAGTLLLEDGVARWNRKRRRDETNDVNSTMDKRVCH